MGVWRIKLAQLAGLSCCFLTSVFADEVTLISHPAKCVSLKQGNTCYQTINLQWQAENKADYCLFNEAQGEALKCWSGQKQGEYVFEFSSAETQHYVLRQQGSNENLAQSSVEVKWVYKVRRNQFGWRVF